MKNFNNSWRKFLNESSRTENVPFKDTRVRIKLENKKKLLYEVSEDEFEHIEAAIEKMADLNELAFNDIFGDKTRLVIDFPTADVSTPLGRFVAMWLEMGYEVDWSKGMVSSERKYIDSSPEAAAAEFSGHGGRTRTKKINNMKIGKWLSKMLRYVLEFDALKAEVHEHTKEHGDWPRVTGNDIKAALGDNGAKNYYRLSDTIDMMISRPLGGHRVIPEYIKVLRKPEKLEELSRYWRDNAADIKKNLSKAQSNEYSIIITRNPIDVWRMSDFRNISSCHTPPSRSPGEAYYKCAVAEAHGHGAVAYAVNTEDMLQATESETIEEAEDKLNQYNEIFYDDQRTWGGPEIEIQPIERVRLRQVRFYDKEDSDGTQMAVPEKRTYAKIDDRIPGFNERVMQWARESQENQIAQAPRTEDGDLKLGDFIKFGGTHDDNPMSILLSLLFGTSIKGVTGNVHVDSTTEDELDDEVLYSGTVESFQRQVNELKEQWNAIYAHTQVDGTAIDDGGGSAYITCGGTLYINWDADDWQRMPNAEPDIRYGLEELKETWGFGWISERAWGIQRKMDGNVWQLPIAIRPEGLAGFNGHEFAMFPDEFENFCSLVDTEVDDKYDAIKALLSTYFKREGYMSGGAIMKLGNEIMNDQLDLYNWEAVAEEDYEPDEYELIQFTAHPEVWYGDLNASEEVAMEIMNDRNFWIELRRRMTAPAFENTGHEMYPLMPLDMDMFGSHGTEGESQELNLYFSVYGDAPDEQVEVLKELVEIWDDQDEINRVASEVFRDMLQGAIKPDGTTVSDLREEKKFLEIEQMLNETINIDVSGHKPKIDNLMSMDPATAKALVSALQDPALEARWAYRIIQRVEEINERIGELEKLGVHYTGYGTVHGTQEQHDEMMNLMDEFNELAGVAGSYEKQFNNQADRDKWEYNRKIRNSNSPSSLKEVGLTQMASKLGLKKEPAGGWKDVRREKYTDDIQWGSNFRVSDLIQVMQMARTEEDKRAEKSLAALGILDVAKAIPLGIGSTISGVDTLRQMYNKIKRKPEDPDKVGDFPVLAILNVDPHLVDTIEDEILNLIDNRYEDYLSGLDPDTPLNTVISINDYIRQYIAKLTDKSVTITDQSGEN